MSFTKKFLSHLFGRSGEDGETHEKISSDSTADLSDHTQPDTDETISEEPIDPTCITLPEDHAVHQLFEMYLRTTPDAPEPQLTMVAPADFPLSTDVLAQEASSFRMLLDRSAQKRLWTFTNACETEESIDADAKICIHFSQNQMVAWFIAYPPIGNGRPLDLEMIAKTLVECKVSFGLDGSMVNSLCTRKDRYFSIIPIAHGTQPIDGIDGSVVDHFPRVIQHEIPVDEYNQVDYTSLNLIYNVEKGDVICDIKRETQGTDGQTVTGCVLSAHNGVAPAIPQGRNTVLSEDGLQLLADCTGHVEFSGRSFQVRPVYDIPGNVDYSTGNINFLGDVHVHGDIISGFSVRAAGNIQVDGVVEAATVEAGGNLVVACGVTGQDRAIIRAHGCIYAKYLENSYAYGRESLQTDCIINCNVYSDNDVIVRSGRGTIIGGTIRASHQVSATTIGSKNETPTTIILGGLPCEAFEREQMMAELAQIEEAIAKLEPKPDSPLKKTQLSEQRLKLYVTKMKLKKFDQDLETLAAQIEEADDRRLICSTIYPNSVVTIGNQTKKIEHTERNCIVHLSNGSIGLI